MLKADAEPFLGSRNFSLIHTAVRTPGAPSRYTEATHPNRFGFESKVYPLIYYLVRNSSTSTVILEPYTTAMARSAALLRFYTIGIYVASNMLYFVLLVHASKHKNSTDGSKLLLC